MIRFTERQAHYAAQLIGHAEHELLEVRVNLCYSRDYFRWARNHGYKDWMIDRIRGVDQLRADLRALAAILAGVAPDPALEAADADPAWGGGEQRELASQPAFTSAAGWWED